MRSARRSIRDIGANAAAGSGTPRLSITSPTTRRSRASGRSRTGSTPPTLAATTVGPTASRGTTARVRGSRSTASSARRAGRPRTTRRPCQRATRPVVSRAGLRASEVELRTGRVPDHHQLLGRCLGLRGSTAWCPVGVASGDSDREPARSPPAGESAHPASIAAAAASARSRPAIRNATAADNGDASLGSGQRVTEGAGWTHADTHDRRPVRCDRRPGPAQAAARAAAPLRVRPDARAPGRRDRARRARPGVLHRARQAGDRGARRRGARSCRLAGVRQAAALGRRGRRRRGTAYDGRGRRGAVRFTGAAPAALPQRPAQGGAVRRAHARRTPTSSSAAGSSWRSRSARTSPPRAS